MRWKAPKKAMIAMMYHSTPNTAMRVLTYTGAFFQMHWEDTSSKLLNTMGIKAYLKVTGSFSWKISASSNPMPRKYPPICLGTRAK